MKNFLTFLSWDTEFFGYNIYTSSSDAISSISKLSPDDLILEAESIGAKLIYLTCPYLNQSMIDLYLASGAIHVDTKITFEKSISLFHKNFEKSNIYSAEYFKRNLNEELKAMALDAGKYSRFNFDANFTRNEYSRLYTKWLENSLSKKIADEVFVATNDHGKPIGFVTISLKKHVAEIGLLSVSEDCRGQGIGVQLLLHAEHYAALNKAEIIRVPTQEKNSVACKFYSKNGYKEFEKVKVFHLWVGGAKAHENSIQ